ncbi:MAG: hypothetical protein WB245_12445 [Acidimicrobiia bacterium]
MKRVDWLRTRALPLSLMVVALGAAITSLVIGTDAELGYDITYPLLACSFAGLATIGAVVTIKEVAPRIGWILVLTGLGGTLSVLGEKSTLVLTESGADLDVARRTLAMAATAFGVMLIGLALLFLLFPNGRLASRRWRPVLWMVPIAGIPFAASSPIVASYVSDPASFLRSNWDYANAGGQMPAGVVTFANIMTAIVVAIVLAGAVSLVLRLRTSTGVERQQVKWVVYAGVAAAIGWFFALAFPFPAAVEVVPAGLGALTLTAGLAISLFRYRLYDIDRVVSRTVGYALVVGVLGLVYAIGAVWLPSRLAGESPLYVAGSTLAVAALFNPLRRRVIRWVDRRFYRSRYDAQQIVDEFTDRLKDQMDAELLKADLVDVISETMQPAAIGMWTREGDGEANPGDSA